MATTPSSPSTTLPLQRPLPSAITVTVVLGAVFLLVAGIVSGLVGTAGGITSLVSYPALLAVGVPALPASVTNSVALVACWPGSAMASQPELEGRRSWLLCWVPVAAAGGALGAALLLLTPAGTFQRVVPFLVVAGAAVLLAQPRLSELRSSGREPLPRWIFPLGLLVLSLYNGYFGAGAGVMLLALLLLTVDPAMPRANAYKNMFVGAASVISAIAFAAFGPVDWLAMLPLAAGMFVGSTLGPRVARWLPANLIRWLAALLGVALAVQLWVDPGA